MIMTAQEEFLEEADPWENDTLTIPTDQEEFIDTFKDDSKEEFIDTFKEENNEALITRRMLFTFGIRNAIHV